MRHREAKPKFWSLTFGTGNDEDNEQKKMSGWVIVITLFVMAATVVGIPYHRNERGFEKDVFVEVNWSNNKFHWGKCDDWPLTASAYESYNVPITIVNYHNQRLAPRLSRHAVQQNQATWIELSKKINAKCTTAFTVPMDWNSPGNGDQLNYFVSKFSADPTVPYKGSVWLLDGGPGGSHEDLYGFIPMVWGALNGAYDLYAPDHRGTGSSSVIKCPYPNDDMRCVDYVKRTYGKKLLNVYTTEQAALDVILAMKLARNEDPRTAPTYLYGMSYGTYWLNRIMQIQPDIAHAFVLDGISPSSFCRFVAFDVNMNLVGVELLAECAFDESCSSKFGGMTPFIAIARVANQIESGTNPCAKKLNLTRAIFNKINGDWLTDFQSRVLILPFIKRLLRCNANDLIALRFLMKTVKPYSPPSVSSDVLSNNVILSELFSGSNPTSEPPSEAEVFVRSKLAYFSTFGPPGLRPQWDYWPKYIPNPKYYNKYARTDRRILLMNGDLDPATPIYWAAWARDHYHKVGNTKLNFVAVPRSVHVTTIGAPTNPMLNETCGLTILKGFLNSQGKTVDTSCTSKVLPLDWQGVMGLTRHASQLYFGTGNMWG